MSPNDARPRNESGAPRGFFLSLEGIEGSGKSTHLERLADRLRAEQIPVTITREPGGTSLGESIRSLLLRIDEEGPVPRAELLLMQAARAQNVDLVIRPALALGHVVLCDRYADASLAYQGGARALGVDTVRDMNRFATAGLVPDLTLLFDLPVPQALARARRRTDKALDRFDREATVFHEAVRDTYLSLARAEPERFHVLDAEKPREELGDLVWSAVEPRLRTGRDQGTIG